MTSDKRQKDLTTIHLHTQLDTFASKIDDMSSARYDQYVPAPPPPIVSGHEILCCSVTTTDAGIRNYSLVSEVIVDCFLPACVCRNVQEIVFKRLSV